MAVTKRRGFAARHVLCATGRGLTSGAAGKLTLFFEYFEQSEIKRRVYGKGRAFDGAALLGFIRLFRPVLLQALRGVRVVAVRQRRAIRPIR